MFLIAFQFAEAGIISLTKKALDILLAFAIQIAYFGEIPNAFTIAGACIITVSVLLAGARSVVDSKSENDRLRRVLCLDSKLIDAKI